MSQAPEDAQAAGSIPAEKIPERKKAGRIIWIYAAAIILTLGIIPPGILAAAGQPYVLAGALVGSTFVFQAAAVGLVAFTPTALAGFIIILSIGLGFIFIEFFILDTLAYTSQRVKRWIDKVSGKARKLRFIKKYGIYTLVPLMWVPGIGLYGGAVISWVLEFERIRSIVLLFLGWFIACLFVFLLVSGVLAAL
jgi:uncharacterized membrane protein